MSPKKKRGGKPPHAPFLCCIWCLYCGQHAGARRAVLATASSSSSNCTFVQIIWHCLPISFKPRRNFIHCEPWTPDTPNGKPAGLSLNVIWRWPRKKKKGGKKPAFIVRGFLCRFCRGHCSLSQQRLLLALERWKGDISLHFGKPQRAHGIIVKYNLACTLQQGLLQQWCTSETNLFSWSLSLWRGCKCYLSFSIKNTAGCAICLAQPSLSSPMPFCADHFTWQFARIFYTLILVNISAFFFSGTCHSAEYLQCLKKRTKKQCEHRQ